MRCGLSPSMKVCTVWFFEGSGNGFAIHSRTFFGGRPCGSIVLVTYRHRGTETEAHRDERQGDREAEA